MRCHTFAKSPWTSLIESSPSKRMFLLFDKLTKLIQEFPLSVRSYSYTIIAFMLIQKTHKPICVVALGIQTQQL